MANKQIEQLVREIQELQKLHQQSEIKFSEYEKGIERILITLQKIQDALLGRIELDGSSGLIEDIHVLKKDRDLLIKTVGEIQTTFNQFHEEFSNCRKYHTTMLKKGFQIPKTIQRLFWIILGGAIVVWYIIDNFLADKIPSLFH